MRFAVYAVFTARFACGITFLLAEPTVAILVEALQALLAGRPFTPSLPVRTFHAEPAFFHSFAQGGPFGFVQPSVAISIKAPQDLFAGRPFAPSSPVRALRAAAAGFHSFAQGGPFGLVQPSVAILIEALQDFCLVEVFSPGIIVPSAGTMPFGIQRAGTHQCGCAHQGHKQSCSA
jgi:hypothetical protein